MISHDQVIMYELQCVWWNYQVWVLSPGNQSLWLISSGSIISLIIWWVHFIRTCGPSIIHVEGAFNLFVHFSWGLFKKYRWNASHSEGIWFSFGVFLIVLQVKREVVKTGKRSNTLTQDRIRSWIVSIQYGRDMDALFPHMAGAHPLNSSDCCDIKIYQWCPLCAQWCQTGSCGHHASQRQ